MEHITPTGKNTAAVFACSPRAGGNSDQAALQIAAGIEQSGGQSRIFHLRDFQVTPCRGCGHCERDKAGRCVLTGKDQSGELFTILMTAPVVVFSSPIFFYHVPSGFKAFIDRAQSFYIRQDNKDPEMVALPQRPAFVCMVAGRPKGEKLFEGALLTLKYFLSPFHRTLEPPLLFRGVDAPGDVISPSERIGQLMDFGAQAWRAAQKHLDTPTP